MQRLFLCMHHFSHWPLRSTRRLCLSPFLSLINPILGDVDGTVTGRIDGLADTGTSAATAFFITSIPDVLSYPFSASDNLLAQPSVTVTSNSFTVTSGVLTAMDFRAGFPIANTTPAEIFFVTLLLNPGSFFVANRISDAVDHKVESLSATFTPVSESPASRCTPSLRRRSRRVGSAWLAQEAEGCRLGLGIAPRQCRARQRRIA